MTINYLIEYSNKHSSWITKKYNSRWNANRVQNSPLHPTIESAENWIVDRHKSESHGFWIDHKIQGYNGHLIPIEKWKSHCEEGYFVDYDGYGNAIDADYKMIDGNSIYPSDYVQRGGKNIPVDTKYILWYNR